MAEQRVPGYVQAQLLEGEEVLARAASVPSRIEYYATNQRLLRFERSEWWDTLFILSLGILGLLLSNLVQKSLRGAVEYSKLSEVVRKQEFIAARVVGGLAIGFLSIAFGLFILGLGVWAAATSSDSGALCFTGGVALLLIGLGAFAILFLCRRATVYHFEIEGLSDSELKKWRLLRWWTRGSRVDELARIAQERAGASATQGRGQ